MRHIQRAAHCPRADDRAERGPRPERAERSFADRGARPERGPRTDRPERGIAERSPRPERAARTESPERGFNDRGASPRAGRNGEAVVSFFNDSKGFGFASDDKGDDLFIHFSNIVGDGFKSLSQGQKITFEEAQGPKGREARNVRAVGGGGRERRY